LTIRAQPSAAGEHETRIEGALEGRALDQIGFDVRYLLAPLKALDCAEVMIETTGKAQPAVLRPYGDESYTYVIMPMHVR
jgi:DNA polymerase-3 subunit beta